MFGINGDGEVFWLMRWEKPLSLQSLTEEAQRAYPGIPLDKIKVMAYSHDGNRLAETIELEVEGVKARRET